MSTDTTTETKTTPALKIVDEREEWQIVAVTPLPPGWVNVWREEGKHYATPAPALLLLESTTTIEIYRDNSTGTTSRYREEHELTREVRVGDFSEFPSEVVPIDLNNIGYCGTTTAEEFAAWTQTPDEPLPRWYFA